MQEFIRVGYYVHNVLLEVTQDSEDPRHLVQYVRRTILNDKPRITKFRICWQPMEEEDNQQGDTDDKSKQLVFCSNSNHSNPSSDIELPSTDLHSCVHSCDEKQTREEKPDNSCSVMKSEGNNESILSL